MKIEIDTDPGPNNRIDAYDAESVTINGQIYYGNILITQENIFTDRLPDCFMALELNHLMSVIDLNPEIIIIGTGSHYQFRSTEFMQIFHDRGIGIELMDTHAACRCFNLLSSEYRQVIGLLFQQ